MLYTDVTNFNRCKIFFKEFIFVCKVYIFCNVNLLLYNFGGVGFCLRNVCFMS